ncbi:MAG: hypothetical protein K2L16_07385 [Muribaculaceae bacterium]|nr:hypothetical protein [Muribaculaceae bacterium]
MSCRLFHSHFNALSFASAAVGDTVPFVRDSSRFEEAAILPVSERRFYGSYERVDGQMRVNTGFGHYSFADSTHRWYVKDWKGSVRHTAYQNKATGKMSFGQHTFVYPSGLPVITSNTGNIDRFHQDKRWIDAEGLDMYDNLARMYDPVYVRFTTPDELAEKFTHVSPWAYCAGNGIAYKDPSGMVIEIAGSVTAENRKGIISELSTLSDDRLVLEKQRNGNYRVNIKEVRKGEHPVGTLLVGSLIKAKETTTIDSGNSLGAILNNKYANRNAFLSAKQSPTGTSIANIMPGLPAKAKIGYNESTGKYIREDSPLFVVISHELTHSHIDLTGNKMEGKVIYRGEEKSAFELQTLGLIGDYPINENKIREEHDVPKRIQY